MDSKGAVEYLTGRDWRTSRLGLARIKELLARMGHPEEAPAFVHLAGTNGKSSTSAMLASVLQAAGYKTGLYTSPYIQRFNERIQVDGAPIDDEALAACTAEVRRHADAMADHPTEFELVTAVGLLHYGRASCDVVVLETGLGGRLDATNAIGPPLLAVITAIGLDHTEYLGDTLAKIAFEKAGIIKPGCDVVLYPQPREAEAVFEAACAERGAPLHRVDLAPLGGVRRSLEGQRFDYDEMRGLHLALLGDYQLANAATVITAAGVLAQKGWPVGAGALRAGLAAARWPARFELLQTAPPFILDGAHNPQGVDALKTSLRQYFPGQKFRFISGVMADKSWREMFCEMLELAEGFYCVTPENPRALPAEELARYLQGLGAPGVQVCATAAGAVKAARAAAGPRGAVCAFGSFYMAGQIRDVFHNECFQEADSSLDAQTYS